MQYINIMSDTGMNPSLPQVLQSPSPTTERCYQMTMTTVTGHPMLRHIIDEPGPNTNHNIRELNTLTDRINLACNVHSSHGHGNGALCYSGITYTACRANRHHGRCLFDRGANGVICGDDVRVISMSDNTLNITNNRY